MEKSGIIVFLVLCVASFAYGDVDCTVSGPGRHPEPTDATCQNYTFCVYDSTTLTYFSYNYTCPTTSVFNPTSAQCTTNYVCPATTPAPTPTSTCTQDGFIADPNSNDCTTYIQCVQINGVFTQTTLTCPANTFYNPTTTFCDPNYNCVITFTCTTVGRFANAIDTTCQSYYYCVLAANGTFVQTQYTCPTTSVFNPNSSICTTNYICPTA